MGPLIKFCSVIARSARPDLVTAGITYHVGSEIAARHGAPRGEWNLQLESNREQPGLSENNMRISEYMSLERLKPRNEIIVRGA